MVLLGLGLATPNALAQALPASAHPRLLLDGSIRAAWRQAQAKPDSAVRRAIAQCEQAQASPKEYARDYYMGMGWAMVLQSCLVAYATEAKPGYAATAVRYHAALLNDLEMVGDGKGGDRVVERDTGYPMRVIGPWTALAYDWLWASEAMTPALKAQTRARWAAWLAWYQHKGYRARDAGANYQAGYLLAATLIAVAQGNEAGESGAALWQHVTRELWGKDMKAGLARGGMLEGGDWAEGWQYAPLALASYALAGRVMRAHGVDVGELGRYFDASWERYRHALAPDDTLFPGGDVDDREAPNVEVNMLGLGAVVLGAASPPTRSKALAELHRLKLRDKEFPLYEALFYDAPGVAPLSDERTGASSYLAKGVATYYVRTGWTRRALWFVAKCAHGYDVDHMNSDAGNFVLARGLDHVIVDPSPYGSLSTLTSNAPTVRSGQLPADYVPSQASWGQSTGWRWVTTSAEGAFAGRCDYADAFQRQQRKTDVALARRDFVMLPDADGQDGVVVILDEAESGEAGRDLYVRFRSPGAWQLQPAPGLVAQARASVGKSLVTVTTAKATSALPVAVAKPGGKDCWTAPMTRGNCDAARMPVSDYRVQVKGPSMSVLHVLTATGGTAPTVTSVRAKGTRASIAVGAHVVTWSDGSSAQLSYEVAAPRGPTLHAIADMTGPAVSAVANGKTCEVKATRGKGEAQAVLFWLDSACQARVVPRAGGKSSGAGLAADAAHDDASGGYPTAEPPVAQAAIARRGGCCDISGGAWWPLALWLAGRRRRALAL